MVDEDLDQNKILDQLVDRKFYPKDLLERMKANMAKEYSDPRHQKIFREFKELMKSLAGSGLSHKIEIQLDILEDIIMDFMLPYTREVLLVRINKKIEERQYLDKKENIEDVL